MVIIEAFSFLVELLPMSIHKLLLIGGLQVIDSNRICNSQLEGRLLKAICGSLDSEHILLLPLAKEHVKLRF